jgi:general secretion pathway protein G
MNSVANVRQPQPAEARESSPPESGGETREARRGGSAGITLIELLVVMVIIAMFATLVGGRLFRNVDKAKVTQAKAQIQEFETVLDMFRLDVGRYPSSDEGLQALHVKPSAVENWDGPYLKKDVPLDPWGHPYVYKFPGQHTDFDLFSMGADGQEGGEGDAADIVNWK